MSILIWASSKIETLTSFLWDRAYLWEFVLLAGFVLMLYICIYTDDDNPDAHYKNDGGDK